MNKCYCGNDNLNEYSQDYYKCNLCNTLVSKHDFSDVCNIESEDEDLYGKNYWEEVMVKEADVKNMDELIDLYIPERATYWLKLCLKYIKLGSTVAEVGCGLGQFSYLLKETGFQPTALELSPQICQYIEKNLGLKTICGELSCSNEKYQTIIAMDVFEHLLEPEEFLEECVERLELGGLLVMQMPCYDPQLSYEEMLRTKPRFKHLLVKEQHSFLYSRESIVSLLKKHGFKNVVFEPSFFGDDYDMMLFAAKDSFRLNSDEDINGYLNTVPNGRIVKALIKLFDDKNQIEKERIAIDEEREKILKDVNSLNQILQEKEAQVNMFSAAAEERLRDNERLLATNTELQQVADERLVIIEKLTADMKMYQQAADERLRIINQLTNT